MKFHRNSATGREGERMFASFVETKLGHICRSMSGNVDIGIDAEVELCDSKHRSTGALLKVQIKTTRKSIDKDRFTIPIDERHLSYFSSLTVPVLFAIVSLPDKAIWWRLILHKENYKGPAGGFGIRFHSSQNRLSQFSSVVWKAIANQSNASFAHSVASDVTDRVEDIRKLYESNNWDSVTLEEHWRHDIENMDAQIVEIETLLKYERRHSKPIRRIIREVRSVIRSYENLKEELRPHFETLSRQ